MTRSCAAFDRRDWLSLFGFVAGCGVALSVSVPGIRVLGDFAAPSTTFRLSVFFFLYPVLASLLGLRLGTASAERDERGPRMLGCLALRVALAQWLCLPFVVFTRALFPGREAGIALAFLYTTLLTALCAVLGRLFERPLVWRPSGSLSKYVLLVAYFVLPLPRLPLLSPLGAVRGFLEGQPPLATLLAIAPPALLLGALSGLALRIRGEKT